ncbi:MAG: 2OG-Fe(II) oxygenase [Kordia sp.]|nr:MAG: 2OG-Fe(II) oxygenase [Kordia sp.]
MNRQEVATLILKQLDRKRLDLKKQYSLSKSTIGYFYIDNILPKELVDAANVVFPNKSELVLKKSLKQCKYVSAQMDAHDSLLEEILYAFQDERIVGAISEICDFEIVIEPDKELYAGGVSLMNKDCFLNPHIDNSHDHQRDRWRILNLLYYVTPNWEKLNGGNLELWPNGIHDKAIEIESVQNRLVVMATHNTSLHSVNKVLVDGSRKCISNYYFSKEALSGHKEFHVTSFVGRPNQKLRNFILNIDSKVRMGVRKFFKKGIRKNPHIYKK